MCTLLASVAVYGNAHNAPWGATGYALTLVPQANGRYVAERLEAQAGRFWLHFDVDVFYQEEMPAVTYPLSDGLG